MRRFVLLVSICLFYLPAATAAPTVSEFVDGFESRSGFLNLYIDHDAGRVYVAIPNDLGELIFQNSLARGIGSNDIGLDRGRLGDTQLVGFVRIGDKALLQAKNTDYRADSDNFIEQQAVTEAFATSVLWSFKVVATSDSAYLIDYTPFLLSDSYDIAATLKQREQGDFKLAEDRSAIYMPMIKSFPKNSELEGLLTYTGKGAGSELRRVTPDKSAVTVHVHHSLVALPEAGFQRRAYHAQSGYFPFDYVDYAAPIEADLVQRTIRRHRLEKEDPSAAMSPAVEPIVYYLDPGVPEPIRSALVDGASWWNQAFTAAGFENAFQVKFLPADADPMDVRYNVIQWVHRRTRGWSYGMSVVDPRTGEIIKGKVTLGSLRIRQDMLIAQGLLSPFKPGVPNDIATAQMKSMALARIRQLSAHEIGHTLGLLHNFAASQYSAPNERGSVMDYPHPMLQWQDNQIDLSSAYAVGIGAWDKHAITYGYGIVPPEQEAGFLANLVDEARQAGMQPIADSDARAAGGGHPGAHLWDDGKDIVASLENTFKVRAIALSQLGEDSIASGQPYSEIERVLVPIFYLHRYQTEAVTKLIGGVDYQYSVKGEVPARLNPVADQQRILAVLLETLDAEFLNTPAALLDIMPPAPPGYQRSRENAPSLTLPYFDPVTAAEASAEETLKLLFNPSRLARVAQQYARDPKQLSVQKLIEQVLDKTIESDRPGGMPGEIRKRVNLLVIEHLLMIAWDGSHVPEVRAIAHSTVAELGDDLEDSRSVFDRYLAEMIASAEDAGEFKRRDSVAKIPPGSPI